MPEHLWRDLGFVLAAKLAALTVIYLLFFGAAHRPRLDEAQMARWILGADASHLGR